MVFKFRFVALLLSELYHKAMNKSTSFQPVSGVVLSGISPRRVPPFLTVWGGQAEREAAFLNIKLHAAPVSGSAAVCWQING